MFVTSCGSSVAFVQVLQQSSADPMRIRDLKTHHPPPPGGFSVHNPFGLPHTSPQVDPLLSPWSQPLKIASPFGKFTSLSEWHYRSLAPELNNIHEARKASSPSTFPTNVQLLLKHQQSKGKRTKRKERKKGKKKKRRKKQRILPFTKNLPKTLAAGTTFFQGRHSVFFLPSWSANSNGTQSIR